MGQYGQFCAVARALETLGGRWTLLIARELLCGTRRFNDIRRGIPRISPTLLSERLQSLVHIGAVERIDSGNGPEYELTDAGRELINVVGALGHWAQRWLPRNAADEDIDLDPLIIDMLRRIHEPALPKDPLVFRLEVEGFASRFILLKRGEASSCTFNPGFPEQLVIRCRLQELAAWWRGDKTFNEARRDGLAIKGPRALMRAFPTWFERYMFADVASMISPDTSGSGGSRPASVLKTKQ